MGRQTRKRSTCGSDSKSRTFRNEIVVIKIKNSKERFCN